MNSQSASRNQKPKGIKVKPAFQIAFLLAICFWLLYQVKQSHGKNSEEHGSDVLGRKGNAGMAGLKDANVVAESVKEEVGLGGQDDVLFTSAEEKMGKESFRKDDDDGDGNLGNHEGNEIEKETVILYKGLSNTVDNTDIEVKGNDQDRQVNVSDDDGQKNVKNTSHDEVEEGKEHRTEVTRDEQESEKDQEKDPKRLEESSTSKDVSVHQEPVVDGEVHGFDDENGVPLGGNDVIESLVTETSGDRARNQSESDRNTVNEELVSTEGTNNADFEAKGRISVEDAKIDAKPKEETSMEIGGGADTSRSDSVSENTQGGRSVSDS